jgi:hypothetical protein
VVDSWRVVRSNRTVDSAHDDAGPRGVLEFVVQATARLDRFRDGLLAPRQVRACCAGTHWYRRASSSSGPTLVQRAW